MFWEGHHHRHHCLRNRWVNHGHCAHRHWAHPEPVPEPAPVPAPVPVPAPAPARTDNDDIVKLALKEQIRRLADSLKDLSQFIDAMK